MGTAMKEINKELRKDQVGQIVIREDADGTFFIAEMLEQGYGVISQGHATVPDAEKRVEELLNPEKTFQVAEKAKVCNLIFTLLFRLQMLTTWKIVVQFSVEKECPFYTLVMQHWGNEETRVFPLALTPEDLATKTDEEIITSTFNDITEMLEKPQEIKTKIIKG